MRVSDSTRTLPGGWERPVMRGQLTDMHQRGTCGCRNPEARDAGQV